MLVLVHHNLLYFIFDSHFLYYPGEGHVPTQEGGQDSEYSDWLEFDYSVVPVIRMIEYYD